MDRKLRYKKNKASADSRPMAITILAAAILFLLILSAPAPRNSTNQKLPLPTWTYKNLYPALHNGPVSTYSQISSLPLIEPYNIQYLGAFKVPGGTPNCGNSNYSCTFAYGGSVAAYDPYNNGLFLSSHVYAQFIAEVSIPAPVLGNNITSFNTATFLQNFSDITDGHRFDIGFSPGATYLCINSTYSNTVSAQSTCGSSSYAYAFNSLYNTNQIIEIINGTGFTPGIYKIIGVQGSSAVLNKSAGVAGSIDGKWKGVSIYFDTSGDNLGGLLVYKHELIGDVYGYYDANGQALYSHFSTGINLGTNFSGLYQVAPQINPGFIAGPMSYVPLQYQSILKGSVITGQWGIPIVSRTSWGPAAFAFNPANFISIDTPVNATPLLYYSQSEPTLGTWGNGGGYDNLSLFNQGTSFGGTLLVPGTQTILFFQKNGIGPTCYGIGTTNLTLVDIGQVGGDHYCYDPSTSSKGTHAYPYIYQILAYNLTSLAEVANGTIKPWQALPYAEWGLPNVTGAGGQMAVTFDNTSNTIYISLSGADLIGCCDYNPLIKVYQINMSAAPAPAYNLGGFVGEATGPLRLQVNGGDTINVSGDGAFQFPNKIANGASFNVTVLTPPTGHICTVRNGLSKIQNYNYLNIYVSCLANATTTSQSTSTTITTTAVSQNGGGGGGAGGASSGGGSFKPSVVSLGNGCYQIANLTSPDYVDVVLPGSSFYMRDNFISPNDTGLTIDNTSEYNLHLNSVYHIGGNSEYNYTISLKGISYLPIIDTVLINMCALPVSQANPHITPIIITEKNPILNLSINVSRAEAFNFTAYHAVVSIVPIKAPANSTKIPANKSKQHVTGKMTIRNITSPGIPMPQHYSLVRMLNLTINSTNQANYTLAVNVSIGYNCSVPSDRLQPFIYTNSSWDILARFSANATLCTVSFPIPADPIIGLFEVQTITGPSQAYNKTTTTPAYANATQKVNGSMPTSQEYDIIGISLIIIVVYLIYRINKGERKPTGQSSADPTNPETG